MLNHGISDSPRIGTSRRVVSRDFLRRSPSVGLWRQGMNGWRDRRSQQLRSYGVGLGRGGQETCEKTCKNSEPSRWHAYPLSGKCGCDVRICIESPQEDEQPEWIFSVENATKMEFVKSHGIAYRRSTLARLSAPPSIADR